MRVALTAVVSIACLALAAGVPGLAALQRPAFDWQAWLKSEYKKVARDSEELVKLTAELCELAQEEVKARLAADLRKRVHALERQAQELRDAVQSMDENVLSVDVVNLSHRIREEAKALKKEFERNPNRRQRDKLRRLARRIEKRADSVYDRTRSP
jgi:hypothetical protein